MIDDDGTGISDEARDEGVRSLLHHQRARDRSGARGDTADRRGARRDHRLRAAAAQRHPLLHSLSPMQREASLRSLVSSVSREFTAPLC